MLTERDLLIDIFQNSPENSIWNISEDSWEEILKLIPGLKNISQFDYGWDVHINSSNRKLLINIIDKYELFDKIIHQTIYFNDKIIFESYDHMSGVSIKKEFPNSGYLLKKYAETDFLI